MLGCADDVGGTPESGHDHIEKRLKGRMRLWSQKVLEPPTHALRINETEILGTIKKLPQFVESVELKRFSLTIP